MITEAQNTKSHTCSTLCGLVGPCYLMTYFFRHLQTFLHEFLAFQRFFLTNSQIHTSLLYQVMNKCGLHTLECPFTKLLLAIKYSDSYLMSLLDVTDTINYVPSCSWVQQVYLLIHCGFSTFFPYMEVKSRTDLLFYP